MQRRREFVTWNDVDNLIDHLIPQFQKEYDAMVMITRGGIVPGGLLAETLNITHILVAAVDFPAELEREKTGLYAWPRFIQFPEPKMLDGRVTLIIDDVWGSGRNITAVKNRVESAGGFPSTCVIHFNPYRSLFGVVRPDYYAAVTDAHVVYPWEIQRGGDQVILQKEEF